MWECHNPGVGRSDDQLLASQIAYYRAHAPRYDDWWFRRRNYDLGEEIRARWQAEITSVRSVLADFAPLGTVLEFAGGTGNWTAELVPLADSVTVVDASPEAVAIAREKIGGNVEWVLADIFSYEPARQYDTVFFGFWLSHVPLERFDAFWSLVADCLTADGRVFFLDNAHPSLGRRVAPELFTWPEEPASSTLVAGIQSVTDLETGVSTRRTADGEMYDVVKIWWEPDQLQARLQELGWQATVTTTEWAFLYGDAARERRS